MNVSRGPGDHSILAAAADDNSAVVAVPGANDDVVVLGANDGGVVLDANGGVAEHFCCWQQAQLHLLLRR
nr:hypothetical protein [uncultured Cohaesibacter sp.]